MPGKLEAIWDALKACFAANSDPLTKAQIITWVGSHFPDQGFSANAIGAQLYRSCANIRSMQRYKTPKFLTYDRRTHTYSPVDTTTTAETIEDSAESDSDEKGNSSFALEAHLRDYLARNLSKVEKGLKLWSENPPSVEYMIGGRRIDLLAKDGEGNPVIIELKLNKGYDKVIGQALLYQGLITRELKAAKVRIILVAYEVSEELKIACSQLSHVALYEYAITMHMEKVSSVLEDA